MAGHEIQPVNRAIGTLATALLLGVMAIGMWTTRVGIDRPELLSGFIHADTDQYFRPAAVYLHDELAAGRLPLWNPYQFAGQPYLALHVPAIFYPPNVLLLALSGPERAMALLGILHMLLAGGLSALPEPLDLPLSRVLGV